MQNALLAQIAAEIKEFARTASDLASLEEFAVEQIAFRLPAYNWVGFYWLDPGDPQMLELGICGAAVVEGETIVVDDVRADPRYLACSIETRSEIVVPIRTHGRIVGEIDIDSHSAAAFGAEDRAFLEQCARIIGAFIAGT
jgi:GAF domain-containing protein